MTETELITRLQTLKEIKPRKDWAFSVKMQVLGLDKEVVKQPVLPRVWRMVGYGKLAYILAAFMFVFTGVFGFAQYTLPGDMLFSVKKITEQSQANMVGESQVKNNVETFKKRSQDLAQVVKENKEANKPAATKEVADAAKTLTEAMVKDPSIAQDIAVQLKDNGALASLDGGADVKEMYKTLVEQLIKDETDMALTEDQHQVLSEVQALFAKEDFLGAFEKNFDLNIKVEPTAPN